jgi:hypothetical protein
LASVFSGKTSWAKLKQLEYSASSPLGAEIQKLSLLISSEISFFSTPGSSISILRRPSLSSWEKHAHGVIFLLLSIKTPPFHQKVIMRLRKFKMNGKGICDIKIITPLLIRSFWFSGREESIWE